MTEINPPHRQFTSSNDHHNFLDNFGVNNHHNTSTASHASNNLKLQSKDEDDLTMSYGGGTYKDTAIERNKRDRIK